MNPRQRRGLLLIAIACLGLLVVFVLIAQYVASCARRSTRRSSLLALAKPVEANQAITDDMVRRSRCPARWAPPTALRDPGAARRARGGHRPAQGLAAAARTCSCAPPDLAPGEREVAILVDAETGVAGKIGPGKLVDIVATFPGSDERKAAQSRVVVPAARIIEVGEPRLKGGSGVQRAAAPTRPGRARHLRAHARAGAPVTYAESNAAEVRLSLLRPGDASQLTRQGARLPARAGPGARAVSHRLLLAIADADVASSAAALAQEGEGLEVVGGVDEAGGGHALAAPARRRRGRAARRARRRPGARPRARDRPGLPGGRARADRRRRLARPAARRDARRPARRRLAPALARAARGRACARPRSGRARCASASRARSRPPARSAAG